MAVLAASHPRKAEMQVAALQVTIDHLGHIGPPEAIARCVAVLPEHFQLLKVVLHAAKIAAGLRISGLVDANIDMLGCKIQHGR